MVCRKCGNKITARICPQCGFDVVNGDFYTVSPVRKQEQGEVYHTIALKKLKGWTVETEAPEFVRWETMAANEGLAKAQERLGWYYDSLLPHSEKNTISAKKWYQAAANTYRKQAELGDTAAQRAIGRLYYEGKGVPLDYSEAMRWYKEAEKNDYVGSQKLIAILYRDGLGVEKDTVEAIRRLTIPASAGDQWAAYLIATVYYDDEKYTEALKYLVPLAEQGFLNAQSLLERMYEQGLGVEKDQEKANYWRERNRTRR